jgi:hypothetical protein
MPELNLFFQIANLAVQLVQILGMPLQQITETAG